MAKVPNLRPAGLRPPPPPAPPPAARDAANLFVTIQKSFEGPSQPDAPEAPLLDVAMVHEKIRHWRSEELRFDKLGFREEAIDAAGQVWAYQIILAHHGLPEVP